MESGIKDRDVSDPLKHLFSLDFGRSSPLLDDVTQKVGQIYLESVGKKVRFQDQCDLRELENKTDGDSSKPKGILKNKLSQEEKETAISCLNTDYVEDDYYSTDSFSSDDYSSDSAEKRPEEQQPVEVQASAPENNSPEPLSFDEPKNGERDQSQNKRTTAQEISRCLADVTVDKRDKTVMKSTKDKSAANRSATKTETNVASHRSLYKPKVHICVVSLSSSHTDNSKASTVTSLLCSGSCASGSEKLKAMSFRNLHRLPPSQRKVIISSHGISSPQTLKLYLMLEEQEQIPSAKHLKSCVFDAWHKVKKSKLNAPSEQKVDKNLSTGTPETKNVKRSPDQTRKAYMLWKQKKSLSRKKVPKVSKDLASDSSETPTSFQKKLSKEEEIDMVYNLWKQKKDEELKHIKEKIKKQKLDEMNKIREKELQKQEAASAYIAWKAIKEKAYAEKKDPNIVQSETERQKALERAEREKEAEEAYSQWLQKKAETFTSKLQYSEHKPAWNPPG